MSMQRCNCGCNELFISAVLISHQDNGDYKMFYYKHLGWTDLDFDEFESMIYSIY